MSGRSDLRLLEYKCYAYLEAQKDALRDNAALIQRASRTARTWKLKGWPT